MSAAVHAAVAEMMVIRIVKLGKIAAAGVAGGNQDVQPEMGRHNQHGPARLSLGFFSIVRTG
jgi:hypothetical protein